MEWLHLQYSHSDSEPEILLTNNVNAVKVPGPGNWVISIPKDNESP